MNITIGENIRNYRARRGFTQEQLAEAFDVSAAAVSKWERGETLPDISLLPQLAYFFRISVDELLGYNEGCIECEIQEIIKKHSKEAEAYNNSECLRISSEAYKRYPGDYRIMELYMWDLIGGYADNDTAVILENKDELSRICERILEGCRDTYIRNDAIVMKGKILHACKRTEEALALYRDNLPGWFQTAEQKSEQLFAKTSEEFSALLNKNICDLASLALNKKSKEIWYDKTKSLQEKVSTAMDLCKILEELSSIDYPERVDYLISMFASDFEAKLRSVGAEEKMVEMIGKYGAVKSEIN